MEKEELKQLLDGLRQAIRDGIDTTAIISSGINDEWGAVLEEKWQANDEALESLVNGWYGRVHAAYNPPDTLRHWDATIWIIRNRVVQSVRENSRLLLNIADEDGLQFMTVLFPNEYS